MPHYNVGGAGSGADLIARADIASVIAKPGETAPIQPGSTIQAAGREWVNPSTNVSALPIPLTPNPPTVASMAAAGFVDNTVSTSSTSPSEVYTTDPTGQTVPAGKVRGLFGDRTFAPSTDPTPVWVEITTPNDKNHTTSVVASNAPAAPVPGLPTGTDAEEGDTHERVYDDFTIHLRFASGNWVEVTRVDRAAADDKQTLLSFVDAHVSTPGALAPAGNDQVVVVNTDLTPTRQIDIDGTLVDFVDSVVPLPTEVGQRLKVVRDGAENLSVRIQTEGDTPPYAVNIGEDGRSAEFVARSLTAWLEIINDGNTVSGGGTGTNVDFRTQQFVATNGQAAYVLATPPTDPESVRVQISAGPQLAQGVDYTIAGSTITLSAPVAAIIQAGDNLAITYV